MKRNQIILTFCTLVILLASCYNGAKVDYLGNHLYFSEYNRIHRRILYQTECCDISGIEIVPMTVMAISHNHYGPRTTANRPRIVNLMTIKKIR